MAMQKDRNVSKNNSSNFRVIPYANVGTSELFVYRLGVEVPNLINTSTIEMRLRTKIKGEIVGVLLDSFIAAFEHLRSIRAHTVGDTPPELNRRQAYDDFMRTLWHAYKDLFPRVVREIGLQIGFLFQDDLKFEQGAVKFLRQHPAFTNAFIEDLRKQRTGWQHDLARIRNDYLEHRKLEWPQVSAFYSVLKAEMFFNQAWNVAADIIAAAIISKFPPMVGVVVVPESQRGAANRDKFRLFLKQPIT